MLGPPKKKRKKQVLTVRVRVCGGGEVDLLKKMP